VSRRDKFGAFVGAWAGGTWKLISAALTARHPAPSRNAQVFIRFMVLIAMVS
jgi:hypothetical protein